MVKVSLNAAHVAATKGILDLFGQHFKDHTVTSIDYDRFSYSTTEAPMVRVKVVINNEIVLKGIISLLVNDRSKHLKVVSASYLQNPSGDYLNFSQKQGDKIITLQSPSAFL